MTRERIRPPRKPYSQVLRENNLDGFAHHLRGMGVSRPAIGRALAKDWKRGSHDNMMKLAVAIVEGRKP